MRTFLEILLMLGGTNGAADARGLDRADALGDVDLLSSRAARVPRGKQSSWCPTCWSAHMCRPSNKDRDALAGQVVIALRVGETYLRICIALVPPLRSHNANDGCQKGPANEGCCHLANDGAPMLRLTN